MCCHNSIEMLPWHEYSIGLNWIESLRLVASCGERYAQIRNRCQEKGEKSFNVIQVSQAGIKLERKIYRSKQRDISANDPS